MPPVQVGRQFGGKVPGPGFLKQQYLHLIYISASFRDVTDLNEIFPSAEFELLVFAIKFPVRSFHAVPPSALQRSA